jgi:hypothetical protein
MLTLVICDYVLSINIAYVHLNHYTGDNARLFLELQG